jgi:hypothetical protein
MNKTKLTGGLIATLLLVSPLVVSADSDYPAYDFEPTIVYQDESVIAQSKAAESAPAPAAAESSATDASSGDDTLIFGVLILAGILFAAYKKSAGAPKKRAAGGATGVSRYLEQHAGTSQSSTAVSGVEKYLQERG